MVWKFQNLKWKFDWREVTLDAVHAIDQIFWFALGLIGGAWVVAIDPGQLAIFRQHGGQMFVTWAAISFGFALLKWGLEKWLGRKEAK